MIQNAKKRDFLRTHAKHLAGWRFKPIWLDSCTMSITPFESTRQNAVANGSRVLMLMLATVGKPKSPAKPVASGSATSHRVE